MSDDYKVLRYMECGRHAAVIIHGVHIMTVDEYLQLRKARKEAEMFDILNPLPTGNRNSDDMGMPPSNAFLQPAYLREKKERAENSNKLIKVIASCGRKFFLHKDVVSKFVIDHHGHIYFIDAFSGKKIYTHYKQGRWRGFTEGGTLRDVVIRLRDYIRTGERCANVFGPWPQWYSDGDPWGYGADMEKVHAAAVELGIIVNKDTCQVCGKLWALHSHNAVGHEVCP